MALAGWGVEISSLPPWKLRPLGLLATMYTQGSGELTVVGTAGFTCVCVRDSSYILQFLDGEIASDLKSNAIWI